MKRAVARRWYLPLAVWLVGALSCATSPRYLHPNADLGNIKTVAVLPFENLTPERMAGQKVQEVFLLELLSTRAFEVVEPGLVAKVLRDQRIESAANMTPDDMKRVGAALKVHGMFCGVLLDYAESRGPTPAPEVSLQLKLIESRTGATVWAASETRAGAGVAARLFGVGDESLVQVVQELIRRQFTTLLTE